MSLDNNNEGMGVGLPTLGCTDPNASNYNPNSDISCGPFGPNPPFNTFNPGCCTYSNTLIGCTDPNATNYNPNVTISCFKVVENDCCSYESNLPDESVEFVDGDNGSMGDVMIGEGPTIGVQPIINLSQTKGCTDPIAINFNPNATIDDGSCTYYTEENPNTCLPYLTKEEFLMNVCQEPETRSDVFIERGKVSVFERTQRLAQTPTIGELELHGYGYYKIRKEEF